MVGWGKMLDSDTGQEITFDAKELDRLLTMAEANELVVKFRNQGLEATDLKNSVSPSDSSSAASAKTAPAKPNAKINRHRQNRSK